MKINKKREKLNFKYCNFLKFHIFYIIKIFKYFFGKTNEERINEIENSIQKWLT